VEDLQRQLSELEGEKAIVVNRMAQLKTAYDANIIELESAKKCISELEATINVKNQGLSSSEERLRNLENQFEKEKKTKAALETELSYRDVATSELQKKLKSSQSRILSLEDEIAKGKNVVENLQRQLSGLKGEKYVAETMIGQLKTTYENLVSDLKKQIENNEVTIKEFEEKISVTFVDRILFEFGKAKIRPKGKNILGKIGNTLKDIQDKQIRVVGHTDDVPISPGYHYKFPSNWELSAARAASVVNYLQNEQGLDPANLEAVGRSFYEPIASNETAEGRAQNRRVNIIIASKVN
jgi:chemotaxis protein MotB